MPLPQLVEASYLKRFHNSLTEVVQCISELLMTAASKEPIGKGLDALST
jgi:hypothetical protein